MMRCPSCKKETSKTRHKGLEYCKHCKQYVDYNAIELEKDRE